MNTKSLLVRGSCLLALVGVVATSAGCEDRVVVRHPAPVVRVYNPPVVYTQPVVVQERVIVR
jgi:hypothetical protein